MHIFYVKCKHSQSVNMPLVSDKISSRNLTHLIMIYYSKPESIQDNGVALLLIKSLIKYMLGYNLFTIGL